MNNLEISKALALAIGWKPTQMRSYDISQTLYCPCAEAEGHYGAGIKFDYRDWDVIGPIAEKFDCFPWVLTEQLWEAPVRSGSNVVRFCQANTPQKAIALAVIGARK